MTRFQAYGCKAKALKRVRASLKQQGINIAQTAQAILAILAILARTTPEAPIPQCPRCHSQQLIATEVMPMRPALTPQPP